MTEKKRQFDLLEGWSVTGTVEPGRDRDFIQLLISVLRSGGAGAGAGDGGAEIILWFRSRTLVNCL